jgi:pimeloyl-ACP methyl ester carboxylesterase
MKKILRNILLITLLLCGLFALLQKEDISLQKLKDKYCNVASKFTMVDGMNVHYRIEGHGKPIVLIHGTGSCLQTWDGWTDSLKRAYTVIRLDMPGFGLTGPRADKDYSAKQYVAFLHKFLTKLNIDTIILAGNSLGGEIAWNYAAAYPSKVSELILVDPAGFYLKESQHPLSVFALAKHKWLAAIMGKLDTRILVDRTLNDVYFDDSKITEATRTMYHDMSLRAGNRQAFTDRVQQIDRESVPDLNPITARTLLMWGREDQLLSIRLAPNFRAIKNSTEIDYDQVGHSPQEEIPGRSVADVMDFIKQNH